MPLIKGKSKGAFEHNLKAEMNAGKPMKQALAIAYNTKRHARKYKGGMIEDDYAHGGYEEEPEEHHLAEDEEMMMDDENEDYLAPFDLGGDIEEVEDTPAPEDVEKEKKTSSIKRIFANIRAKHMGK